MNNLLHKKYGKLTVIKRDYLFRKDGSKTADAAWLCLCDCGKNKVIRGSSLISGKTKTCGCSTTDAVTTHGMSKTRTYSTWRSMRERCLSETNKSFHRYGGRGITVCDRWVKNFKTFVLDMGEKPTGMSLERINNDKGYSPDNCRWATKREQDRNKSTNRFIEHNGERLCVSDWAAKIGISHKTLHYRIVVSGWSHGKALTPIGAH